MALFLQNPFVLRLFLIFPRLASVSFGLNILKIIEIVADANEW